MTRPLRYDDSFLNILKEKLHDKFLNIFNIKVQSTAFFQKCSLLQALLVVGLFDLFFGIVYLLIFFKIVHKTTSTFILIQDAIMITSIFFGLIGINASSTMSKRTCHIYKNWRIFITFFNPVLEMFNGFYNYCYSFDQCNQLIAFIVLLLMFILNLYLTFVSWSFYVRLDKSHELLIIHGKYLEKMMENDNYKIMLSHRYMPPDVSSVRGSNIQMSLAGENTLRGDDFL